MYRRPESPDRERLISAPSDPINEIRNEDDYEDGVDTSAIKADTSPQYIATIAASMSALAAGIVLGWTSPITVEIENGEYNKISVDHHQMGWIGAIVLFGGLISGLFTGRICDTIGRKTTLLILTLPFAIGWGLILNAHTINMLYVGRFVTGLAAGGCSIAAPMYINEIAQREIRGTLGSYFQLMTTLGILYAYIFGKYLSIMYYTISCAIVPVVFLLFFIFQSETPVYYLKNNEYDKAAAAMGKLRGSNYNPHYELRILELNIPHTTMSLRTYIFELNKTKLILFALALFFFQQFCGINPVIFYTSVIFNEARVALDSKTSAIIVAIMQVIATFVSSLIVDKLGRRKLLIFSLFTMGVSLIALGVFFTLKNRVHNPAAADLGFLPVLSLSLYIIAFSMGMGPIPWIIPTELFQADIKGSAISLASGFNWGLAFLITKFYLDVEKIIGQDVSFYVFSVMCFAGVLFVYFILPETKGKTPEEIQDEVEN